MSPFFVYLLKSSVCLALFYIVFRLAMSRDKSHSFNRFLLLGIMFVSAIIPLLNFQFFKEEVIIQPVSVIRDFIYTPVEIINAPQLETVAEPVNKAIEINWWFLFYSLAITALVIRLAISLARVIQLLRGSEKMPLKNVIVAVIKEMIQPFTFLNYIIISKKDYQNNKDAVIAHEQEHIRQMHTIDLFVCEVFTLLHWFNPFMWLLRRDLKLIHEFQADQAVLNTGIDAKKYQLLVLEKAVGERRFALANHFTQKPILKRIKMMKTNKKARWGPLKILLFIPLGVLILQAFTKPNIIESVNDKIIPLFSAQENSQTWIDHFVEEGFKSLKDPDYKMESNKLNLRRIHIVEKKDKNFYLGDTIVEKKNVFIVLHNLHGELMAERKRIDYVELKSDIKNFISGKSVRYVNPEFIKKNIPLIGESLISVGVITYMKDLATPEASIKQALSSLGEAYLEVRKEKAQDIFNQDYLLLEQDKKDAIDQLIPIQICFAIPKMVGNKKAEQSSLIDSKKEKIPWTYENMESIGENILTETGHNPNYGDYKKTKPVSLNNILLLLIDKDNNVRVKGEIVQKEKLNSVINDFVIKGINQDGNKVTEITKKDLPHFGKVEIPQGIINFRFDVAASYWSVKETIELIGEIFFDIKDEFSLKEFNQPYLSLNEEYKSEIDELIPIRISTGEPMVENGAVSFADGI